MISQRPASQRPSLSLAVLVLTLALGGSAPAMAGSKPGAKSAAAPLTEAQSTSGVVNLNAASPEQLELLPGIGPAKAKAIIAYRTKHKFSALHELMRVRGIGRKNFAKLRPYLTLSGPTTLTAKPQRTTTKSR